MLQNLGDVINLLEDIRADIVYVIIVDDLVEIAGRDLSNAEIDRVIQQTESSPEFQDAIVKAFKIILPS